MIPATLNAVSIQVRVMYAILIRDVKIRFKDSPIGIFSAVLEPLAHILILSLLFSYVRFRTTDLGEYLTLFFMTGLLPLFCFKMSMQNVHTTMMKHRMTMYAPVVRPIDLMVVAYVFTVLVYISLFAMFDQFYVLVYDYEGADNFILCMIPMLCNGLIGLAFGMVMTIVAIWFRYITVIMGIVFGPVNLLSGMFFTAETLPPIAVEILAWNPFFQSTELLRTYYYYEYESPIFDPLYYYGWVVTCTALALVSERVMRHRLVSRAG